MPGRAWTAAALPLLGALAFTAPALGATSARDFERPLTGVDAVEGAGARSADGAVTHRSDVVLAGAEFDAVGLAGETRAVEMRSRRRGEPWSEWYEIDSGNPLYVVGGADRAQLRTRGWRPEGKLHFVDVSVDEGSPGATTAAKRETPKPEFLNRSEWGASDCKPRTAPSYGRVKAVVIHHTVSNNNYSRAEAKGIVLAICRYHRNGNGWNDIGYNALVDRFGRLYEGRAGGLRKPVIGAHAEGYNAQTAGIAAIGNHVDVPMPLDARGATARYIAWKLDAVGKEAESRTTLISRGGSSNRYPSGKRIRVPRVIGHRNVGLTSCPGGALGSQLPKIRARAQRIQDSH